MFIGPLQPALLRMSLSRRHGHLALRSVPFTRAMVLGKCRDHTTAGAASTQGLGGHRGLQELSISSLAVICKQATGDQVGMSALERVSSLALLHKYLCNV